ncbi:MAG TPA: diguanylate cyclase [Candidatus Limnocylindrales bacterium]|nr:diguanylate cyclase [Candidatus Limnocylindrales bacterium]
MNLSAGTVFAFVVGTMATGIVLATVWPAIGRARRERHFAMVDVLLASSYIGTSRGTASSSTPGGTPGRTSDRADVDAMNGDAQAADEPRPETHRAVLDAASFEAVVSHEDAREERYRRPTTVVVLELDGLDRLVERLGVAAGDRVEPDVADTIAKLARRSDYVARLAPGRFAVLMPETDQIVAINYVERIRQACDEWLASGAIAMRLAIGWASTAGSASVTTAMQVAVDRMHLEERNHARLTGDAGGDAAGG